MRCSVWANFSARGAKEKWGISRVPGGRKEREGGERGEQGGKRVRGEVDE